MHNFSSLLSLPPFNVQMLQNIIRTSAPVTSYCTTEYPFYWGSRLHLTCCCSEAELNRVKAPHTNCPIPGFL
jgi:hypothetical protein